MELDPILSALIKLEQPINNGYNDLNDKYQLVYAQLDAINMTGSNKKCLKLEFTSFLLVIQSNSSCFCCVEIRIMGIGCKMAKLCSVVFRLRSLVNIVVGRMHFEKNASKVFQRFFSEER
jgi:hypothetical protein